MNGRDQRLAQRSAIPAGEAGVGEREAGLRVLRLALHGGLELLHRLAREAGAREHVGDASGDVAAVLADGAEALELLDRRAEIPPGDGALEVDLGVGVDLADARRDLVGLFDAALFVVEAQERAQGLGVVGEASRGVLDGLVALHLPADPGINRGEAFEDIGHLAEMIGELDQLGRDLGHTHFVGLVEGLPEARPPQLGIPGDGAAAHVFLEIAPVALGENRVFLEEEGLKGEGRPGGLLGVFHQRLEQHGADVVLPFDVRGVGREHLRDRVTHVAWEGEPRSALLARDAGRDEEGREDVGIVEDGRRREEIGRRRIVRGGEPEGIPSLATMRIEVSPPAMRATMRWRPRSRRRRAPKRGQMPHCRVSRVITSVSSTKMASAPCTATMASRSAGRSRNVST